MIDVLVVDDDFRVAEINAKYVGKVPGFRVAARAHSAAQALASVQRGTIDLVLLDHYLPDQTGLELVHRMREQGHGTDVIMITAAGDVTTIQTAMRLGALHYLVKPFTFAALRTTPAPASPGLPSGHSEPTTDLICRVLHHADHPLSAHEVAAETGLSRSTAQRYLRHLEQAGRLRLSLRYGDTGRPEHRYAWVAP